MGVVGYGGSPLSAEEADSRAGLRTQKHTVSRLHVAWAMIGGVFRWSGQLGPLTAQFKSAAALIRWVRLTASANAWSSVLRPCRSSRAPCGRRRAARGERSRTGPVSEAVHEEFEVVAHGLGDWELTVGVEPLEPDAVEVGDDGGGFPVGVDVGSNFTPVDALAD